jgi:hypothetical protein
MPCSASRRSLASLHFFGLPTITGTMRVSLSISDKPAALSTAFNRAARSWWRSRSHCEALRCRIAAGAGARLGSHKISRSNPEKLFYRGRISKLRHLR